MYVASGHHGGVIRTFKSQGLFEEADDCYYERMEHLTVRSTSDWILRKLSWATCGYGVRPMRTIGLSLILIGMFAIAYRFGGGVRRAKKRALAPPKKGLSLPDALYFSALVYFVALPPPAWEAKGRWRFVIMAEDILGWLLTTLFVVTLGNVMIR